MARVLLVTAADGSASAGPSLREPVCAAIDSGASLSMVNFDAGLVADQLKREDYEILVLDARAASLAEVKQTLEEAKHRSNERTLCITYDPSEASRDAVSRTVLSRAGSHVYTHDIDVLCAALKRATDSLRGAENSASSSRNPFRSRNDKTFRCPDCGRQGMSEDQLWHHMPLFHGKDKNISAKCPICSREQKNFAVHLHESHGPIGRGEIRGDGDRGTELYVFALMVCRRKDGKFLLVHEVADWGWWLPGGHVDAGEQPLAACIRETREEANVDVRPTGILRVEFSPHRGHCRMRVIFCGEPVDQDASPKQIPDFESIGAAWVDVEQIDSLPLRGEEPRVWCNYVAKGGPIYPLSILTSEGAPVGAEFCRPMKSSS